jgi:hypothetical protein
MAAMAAMAAMATILRGAAASSGVQRATYRGVSWRRNPDGAVGWYNEGLERWVRWRPGRDAPPPPPRWVAEGLPDPPPRVARARWRSAILQRARALDPELFDARVVGHRDPGARVGQTRGPGRWQGSALI